MRETIIAFIFCAVIFSITISTLFKQTISLFKPSEEKSDVVIAHENQNKEEGIMGMLDSFTSNLTGKEAGAKQASEVSKKTTGNTYIESSQVLLGKENWLFYKSVEDGDPISDYQGTNHYSDEQMNQIMNKLMSERDEVEAYNCDFYILSIPNKASVYSEYMPDTIIQQNKESKTEIFMDYLEKNSDLNVVDVKDVLVKAKEKAQVYYKKDTHFNAIGCFLTIQALKDQIDGNIDSLSNVKFNVTSKEYSGDLASLCDMNDTFKDDIYYEIDSNSVNETCKSNLKVLVIGDSFSEHMDPIMSLYFKEVQTVNIWSFTTDMLTSFQPDIVVWECAERYTDRYSWVELLSE